MKKVILFLVVLLTGLGLFAACSGHTYGDWVVTKEATCQEEGQKEALCTDEGCNEKKTETIPIISHSYQWVIRKEADCSEDGLKEYTCSACGDVADSEVIEAYGHDYQWIVTTPATCENDGLKKYTCSVCGDVADSEVIEAPGHDYQWIVTTPATCESDGLKEYICSVCGDVADSEVIEASGHDYQWEVTTPATCHSDGLKEYICSACGDVADSEIIPIDPDSHTYGDWIIDKGATCTEDGSRHRVCDNPECGHIDNDVITAPGHDYQWIITTPVTCHSAGLKEYICSVCSDVDDSEIIPIVPDSHTYGEWITDEAATCTETGSKHRDCLNEGCDHTETVKLAKVLHSYQWVVSRASTSTLEGLEVYQCSACGNISESRVLPLDPNNVVPRDYSDNVATASEINGAISYYDSIITNMRNFPASFKIGSASYSGFNFDFIELLRSDVTADGVRRTAVSLEHTSSGLVFTVNSILYIDYAAYEWVINISNPTDHDSPVISDLYGLNRSFEGEVPVIYTTKGDETQYRPETVILDGVKTYSPSTGRSTQGAFPYYNIEYGPGGMFLAIGWAGQWFATFDNSADADSTLITAGQKSFNSYLKPGENIRTPTISIINYEKRDTDRATNLWRRWYIDNIMYRVLDDGERVLFDPQIAAHAAPNRHEEVLATEENMIAIIEYLAKSGLDLTFFWIDAGWYFDVNDQYIGSGPTSWQKVGTWVMDTERFPTGMKAITDLAAEYGIKVMLWFEPERFMIDMSGLKDDGTTLKPEWVINGTYVDFSNPDCVEWITNHVITVMQTGGISLYREDYNIHTPEIGWQAADALQGENREGITENKHIQGHFEFWDAIVTAFPGSPIDACASGGFRLDLDTMRYAVSLHRTDFSYSDNLANQLYSLEMAKWFPYFSVYPGNQEAVKYDMRMSLAGAFFRVPNVFYNIALDVDIIKDAIEEFNTISKYYYSDYYTLTDYDYTENSWIGWQYFDEDLESGYALYFRHKNAPSTQTLYIKGLDPDKYYHVWFEDRGEYLYGLGSEFMADGVLVTLPAGETSDIMYIATVYKARDLEAKVTRVGYDGIYGDAVEKEDGYSRFDIRFNMSLLNTVFTDSATKLQKDITSTDLLGNIKLNGTSLLGIYNLDNGNVKLEYDVINNILRVYIKDTYFDFRSDATVILNASLATYADTALSREYIFKYHSAIGEWAEGGNEPVKVPELDMDYYEDTSGFESITDLSEEKLESIGIAYPWGVEETGLFAWSYGSTNGVNGVYSLTDALSAQYNPISGTQSIVLDYDRMENNADYLLTIGFANIVPGSHIKMTVMVKADVSSLNDIYFLLRNENNADGGYYLTNYIVKGKLVMGEWIQYSLEFIAAPDSKGVNLLKFAARKMNENASGKIYIDNIKVTVEEYPTTPLDGYVFEEGYSDIPLSVPWDIGSSNSGFYAWQYAMTEDTVFSIEEGDSYDGNGKVLVADFNAVNYIARLPDAGYLLDYYFKGLEDGKTYYLTFRIMGDGLTNLRLTAIPEQHFGKESENKKGTTIKVTGKEHKIAITDGTWTDIVIPFVASPDSTGLCALRFYFRPTIYQKINGRILFDDFALEESTFKVGEFGSVSELIPYQLPAGFEGPYGAWAYLTTGLSKIFYYDSESYYGNTRSIMADLSDVTSTYESGSSGHGYFLDYYMKNLVIGKTYTLSFMYKTSEFADAVVQLHCEHNFSPNNVTMKTISLYGSDDWTLVSFRFTVNALVEDVTDEFRDLHCIRIAVYPEANKTGTGKVWFDGFSVSEYTPPEPTGPLYAEDEASIGTIGYLDLITVEKDGFTYWSTSLSGNAPEGVLSLDDEMTKEGYGNSIKLDLNMPNLPSGTHPEGGYWLNYAMPGLIAGKDYELSFYIRSSNLSLGLIYIEDEYFYHQSASPTVIMSRYTITNFSLDAWTKITVRFKAAPDAANGLCMIRIVFAPGLGETGSGALWLDEFDINEYTPPEPEGPLYAEDELESIANIGPWDINSSHADGLYIWWNEVASYYGFVSLTEEVTKEGYGKAVKVDLTYGDPALVWYGGYYLDYYMGNLVAGKQYILSFYIKSDGFILDNIAIENEANYGATTNFIAKKITDYPSDWTLVEIIFTAAPDAVNGLCGIRIGLYPGTENGGAGVLYLDEFDVNPYVSDGDLYDEDTEDLGFLTPWTLPGGYDGGFGFWSDLVDIAGNTTMFTKTDTETKEGYGYSIMVDASEMPVSGTWYNGFYLDYYLYGLTDGKEYVFTFYYKVSSGFILENIIVGKEYNAPTSEMDDLYLTDFTAALDWTKVELRFIARPNEGGIASIRFNFLPGTTEGGSGFIYLDEFNVTEAISDGSNSEDKISSIPELMPYAVEDTGSSIEETFYFWGTSIDGAAPAGVISLDNAVTKEGIGKSIKLNLDIPSMPSGTHPEGGYYMNYYMSGLTAGKEYILSFYMKSSNLLLSQMFIENEGLLPSNGSSISMTRMVITQFPSDWTKVTVAFTANPLADGACVIRIAFCPGNGETGLGALWLDEFEVNEKAAPDPLYAEDTEDLEFRIPWSLPGGYDGGFGFWSDLVDIAGNTTMFTKTDTETKEGYGYSIMVDASEMPVSGTWYNGFYLDYYLYGLTDGTEYVFTFYYKVSSGFMLENIIVGKEHNAPTSEADDLYLTNFTEALDWTKVELRFIARPNEGGIASIRFNFLPGTTEGGSGFIYLDEFNVTEAETD